MQHREDTTDIIEAVINSMTFPVKILSVATNAGVQAVKTCDILHAEPKRKVTIGGKEYVIKDIDPSTNTLFLIGTPPITAPVTFNLYSPKFFHGTPIQQGMELEKKQKATDKTPMVWLHEQFTDTFYEDLSENKERDVRMRLFFLTQASYKSWLTEHSYHNAIKPMRRLAEHFIETLKTFAVNGEKRFDTDKMSYDFINYHSFGVFISNRGMEKSLWADELAGVELAINLPVNRITSCPEDECES